MNDELDALEAELQALRPQEISPDLRRRVADRLTVLPVNNRRGRWQVALAGAVAAACLAAVLAWWVQGRDDPVPIVVVPPIATPVEVDGTLPTLLTYRIALARSPEALDDLLDRQAVSDSKPDPQLVQISAATRSGAALHALLGDN